MRARIIFSVLFLSFHSLFAQRNFYETDTIQVIDVTFAQSNWEYQMDTANAGSGSYILAQQVRINNAIFDSVGVRFKGGSSYDTSFAKNPLHIKLDHIHGSADYYGYTDVKLSNEYYDPSMVREVLAYEVLRNYMAAPLSNFARVFINGRYFGVYTNNQSIDKDFLSDHFYSSDNSFFKCNPVSIVNGQYPNLSYLGTDSANYTNRYEIKSDYTWKDLTSLCDTLNNFSASLDSILDIDRAIWMLAFNNVTVNLDSYTGVYSQNYYLYRDDNRRFDPIIWDLNMCFGGFRNTGSALLSLTQMQQMSPILHSTNTSRPLILKLLADPTYYKMYIAHMRTISNEMFASGNYFTRAQALQTLIDSSAQADTCSFYTYSQFQTGLTVDNGNIPGVSNLMSARVTYLNSTTQFQQVPPVIMNYSYNPSSINLYDTIWVRSKVSDATAVYLGSRSQTPYRFRRVQMFDDGLHHDSLANDSIYGASMIARSAVMEYYIYAQNTNAGIFSPARAEYEYHTVPVTVSTPQLGDVVINEFLTDNTTGPIDENGKHEDWIEVYNLAPHPIRLLGVYLSDSYLFPLKWAFPDIVLPVNGYVIIWADEDPSTVNNMHANFKLSAFGEQIMLSDVNLVVLDSASYGAQTTNISYGRCPNGTGPFGIQPFITFDYSNCGVGIEDTDQKKYALQLFPNPAKDIVSILSFHPDAFEVKIFDLQGQVIAAFQMKDKKAEFEVGQYGQGTFLFTVNNSNGAVLQKGKFIVTK